MTTRRDDGNFPVSTYGFEADPNLVLGVTPSSSLTEIRDAYRDKVKAYASSQHHATIEEFVEEVKLVKSQGF